jgi:crotonobetaine/carnitine-CoA ligase
LTFSQFPGIVKDVETVISNRSIASVLREKVARESDRPFVKCGTNWTTLGQLDARSAALGRRLSRIGLGRGDRLAMLSPNRAEVIDMFFACARLGIVLVPLNCFLKGEFLAYQLADSGAEVLIGDADGVAAALEVASGTRLRRLISLDGPPAGQAAVEVGALAQLSDADGPLDEPTTRPSDLFSILYTSGTTGMPKGCMIPNGYYFANAAANREAGWVEVGDRLFTAFPLFHMSGHHCLMAALVNDASVCFEPTFSVSTFLARAEEEGATVLMGVGPMAMALLMRPPEDDDRGHRFRMAMMTPMPPDAQAAFEARFNTPVIAEGYGQTECSPATISSLHGERRRASVGRPVGHLEVQIVDDDDHEVGSGVIGEIVLRPRVPDVVFQGYWNKPDDTVEAFRNLWHHTGDLGSMDDDGFVTFVDRKKDSLRRRGENVSSFEVEATLLRHPAIAQVAVSAVPSPLGEDDIKASVVFAGDAPTPQGLFAFCKESLPYFAIPRYVDVRDALPVNALGRVQKHLLRDEGIPEGVWDLETMGLVVHAGQRRGR